MDFCGKSRYDSCTKNVETMENTGITITKDDIEHLALLSRITLEPSDVRGYQKNLQSILEHVSQLQEIDTEGVSDTNQVTGMTNVTREDEACASGLERELLENAETAEGQHIRVHSVIS